MRNLISLLRGSCITHFKNKIVLLILCRNNSESFEPTNHCQAKIPITLSEVYINISSLFCSNAIPCRILFALRGILHRLGKADIVG
jgi:hypothetical protein